uniref:glutamate decarboxylase 1-like isoform X1 n=1 Tax=Styela clava TaxID=7725 RepID=UPI00193A20E3|nr:glutamate decarboxylase 1-like isoform X1 [Styela clava]
MSRNRAFSQDCTSAVIQNRKMSRKFSGVIGDRLNIENIVEHSPKTAKEKKKVEYDFGKLSVEDIYPKSKSGIITEEFMNELLKILVQYVHKTFDRKSKILDFHHPHQFLDGIEGFSLDLDVGPQSLEQLLVDCRDTLKYGVKTGHPRFFNQLSSGLDVISLAAEWVTSTANTNMFTFEIAPVFVCMETIVLRKMRQIIGWEDGEGDGIFSPGGSINNMYAAMIARNLSCPDVKKLGMKHSPDIVMFVSKHAHYSNSRPAITLGIGTDNVILVDVDNRGRMKPCDLEKKIQTALLNGKQPFYVCATAATTVLGAFDPITPISAICKKYGLWLHVDAAWGGGALMSKKHHSLLRGIDRADSVTWNPHKMMGITLQCSALLIKHKNLLEECNKMEASYLFQQDKHYDVSYDTGDKTIQCGRHVDVFKLWLSWRAKGDEGFEKHVDKCIEMSTYMTNRIKSLEGFELVMDKPQYTNVCFWYLPPWMRTMQKDSTRDQLLGKIAPIIKARMMECGSTMIGYQPLDDKVNFFRCVISNHAVEKCDVDFLLDEIQRLGENLKLVQ